MGFAADFSFSISRVGDGLLVSVSGEVDMATAPALEAALAEHALPGTDVVVDMRGVTFVDTAGLRLAIEQHQRAEREGHRFALVRGGPEVQRLFEVAGLAGVLEFVDAPAEVLGP